MPKIDLREDERTEFREIWAEEALKDLAAFANHKGGTLYLGVRDDGEVIGSTFGDRELQRITNQVVDSLALNPRIEIQEQHGKQVVVVEVPSSPRLALYRGRPYTRVGSTSREMTPEQLHRRVLTISGQTWDALPSPWGLEAAEENLVRRFVGLAKDRLPTTAPSDSAERILRNLGLVHDDRLTNAAVLLFTPAPQALYPTARVRIAKFRGEQIIPAPDLEGPLWNQLDRAMDKLRDLLEVRFEVKVEGAGLEGLQRRETWEYPREALREAVINALIHRDYAVPGDIQMRVHDDRLALKASAWRSFTDPATTPCCATRFWLGRSTTPG